MLSNKNRMLLQSIKTFVARDVIHKVTKVIEKVHPADLGLVFGHLRISEARKVLDLIPDVERRAEVISEMTTDVAVEILGTMTPVEISVLLQEMSSDDAAQVLERFDEDLRDEILRHMADVESKEVEERFEYAEQTAGRIMVSDFLALAPESQVGDAIAQLQTAEDLEIVYYLYIVGEAGQLVGVVSLRQLLLVPSETPLRNVMNTDVIAVQADEDQEEVARKVARYNLLAIPVVDDLGKMLGIITVDDVIDIIKEEATEDMLFMAGAGAAQDPLVSGSIMGRVRSRYPWLLASWLGGLFAFFVTDQFEASLAKFVLLAGFIPIVLGMGGNVGTQSSILVVRGLATRALDSREILLVTLNEIKVGTLLGLLYGLLLAAVVMSLDVMGIVTQSAVQAWQLGLVVGLGIFCSMLVASVIGAATPLLLDRLGIDPAIATGPLVTTSVDVLGVLAYLSIATTLLGL